MKSTLLCGMVLIALSNIAHAQTATAEATSTGITQVQAAPSSKSKLQVGTKYYISTERLNVRSSNQTDNSSNVIGQLALNDQVILVNPLNAATPLIQVRIEKSAQTIVSKTGEYFISGDYVSATPSAGSSVGSLDPNAMSKYIVIQNVATEKTRVYEVCTATPGCPHKLVFETDMVVGRPEEGTEKDEHAFKTWLGHSVVRNWVKFYEDGQLHYPAWYHERFNYQDKDRSIPFDHIPRDPISGGLFGSNGGEWFSDDYLTDKHGEKIGVMRGAFGWYAARLYPEEAVNYQWMHGTLGWGKDGDDAIKLTRGFIINMFANPGSSGCTRLENRAIAYLRHLLAKGTHIYRIYAQEGQVGPISQQPKGKWEFILTKRGAQQADGETADAATVLKSLNGNLKSDVILERGVYEFDQTATPKGRNYYNSAAGGDSGDRYRLEDGEKDQKRFKGVFVVNAGQLVGYQHPKHPDGRIKVGGLADFKNTVPEILVYKEGKTVTVPSTKYKKKKNGQK